MAITVPVEQEKVNFEEVTKTMAKKRTRQAGKETALFEAAFTALPLFMFATMETGRFLNVQQTLTEVAREGVRLGIAPLGQTETLAHILVEDYSLITLSMFGSSNFLGRRGIEAR